MEAPPPSTTSIRLDSAVKIEPNEVEMDIEINDDILDYFPVSDSNGITVSGFTIFDAFQKSLRRIKTMEEQLASCLENQSVATQAIDKCSALEKQVEAVKEDLDGQISKTQDQHDKDNVRHESNPSHHDFEHSEFEGGQLQSRSWSGNRNHYLCKVCPMPNSKSSKARAFPSPVELAHHYTSQHSVAVIENMEQQQGRQHSDRRHGRGQSTKWARGYSNRRVGKAGSGPPRQDSMQIADTRAGGHRYKKCEFCGERFANLGEHMKTHTKEKPYQCSVCDRAFSRAIGVFRHERTHNGERPYKCSVCQRAFSLAGNLKKHERTHNGEKPYQCSACDRKFSRSDELRRHERMHNTERPHKCQHCDLRFATSASRLVHERIHTERSNGDVNSATYTSKA